MRSGRLIYNPRAGGWRTEARVDRLRRILQGCGFDLEAVATRAPGHATTLAREAAAAGAEVVLAFGGDGTLREAAAGLLGTVTTLAPLPGGTVNVVAHSLGFPADAERTAESLATARELEMDVGRCGEEIFLMQASCGLDARILAGVRPRLKRHLGRGAVGLAALWQWARYPYPEIDLTADGRPSRATFLAACNLSHYGGRFRLAPEASCTDGRLDLVFFRGGGRLATLGFARDLALGRHLRRPDTEIRQVKQIELRGSRELAVQVDGDPLPVRLPVTIRIAPKRLRLLVPCAAT